MEEVSTIGLDLAKSVFQVQGIDAAQWEQSETPTTLLFGDARRPDCRTRAPSDVAHRRR